MAHEKTLNIINHAGLCLVTQSCPTLCDPMDCNPPGSSVPLSCLGIHQAGILEWVAMPSSRWSLQPRDQTQVSSIAGWFFTIWAAKEAQEYFTRWAIWDAPLIIRTCKSKPQWDITSHLSEWLSKRLQITNVGKDVEKKEPLYTADRSANWHSPYGKQYDGALKS